MANRIAGEPASTLERRNQSRNVVHWLLSRMGVVSAADDALIHLDHRYGQAHW
jgi:hypothetical protein